MQWGQQDISFKIFQVSDHFISSVLCISSFWNAAGLCQWMYACVEEERQAIYCRTIYPSCGALAFFESSPSRYPLPQATSRILSPSRSTIFLIISSLWGLKGIYYEEEIKWSDTWKILKEISCCPHCMDIFLWQRQPYFQKYPRRKHWPSPFLKVPRISCCPHCMK